MDNQDTFDQTIGRLDHTLSKLILFAELPKDAIGTANIQTLKHHAEDMIGAGNKILELIGK